ncbi:hypothetical protein [Streptomyces sp. NRRL S-31]|uniref:hypothetical protein n=1 Tax=Streptomyces sp. NRRL S-31 TaxID=1463898 RepID=UPI000AC5379D|nr:hypothetical protein [Streptomyces sp. NRRL S-31]
MPVAGFLAVAAAVSCVCVLVLSETDRREEAEPEAVADDSGAAGQEPSLTAN